MTYLTPKETLLYLRQEYGMSYSKSALEKYRRESAGPRCLKLAGKIWYRTIDVDEWVQSATCVRHGREVA